MGTLTGRTKLVRESAWAAALNERRGRPRYPFEQDLMFRRRVGQAEITPIPGRTLNMSSRGILFEADSTLEEGEILHMVIRWPARLENRHPMKMVVTGKVVRCSECRTAVAILQYEFRTAGSNGLTL